MKKTLAAAALTLLFAAIGSADMALIYDNDAAVTGGRSWPATVADGRPSRKKPAYLLQRARMHGAVRSYL